MKSDHRPKINMDAAIDRAVRSIMSAEPRAGLRQRVLSRINEAPRRAFPLFRLAIVGGSIAAIALAVALRVGDRPAIREEHVSTPPPTVAAPPREQPMVRETPRPMAPAPPARRPPTPSQPVPRGLVVAQNLTALEDDDIVDRTRTTEPEVSEVLEPLRTPSLSRIEGLEMPSATVPAIAMTPIGISELPQIAPLQGPIR